MASNLYNIIYVVPYLARYLNQTENTDLNPIAFYYLAIEHNTTHTFGKYTC